LNCNAIKASKAAGFSFMRMKARDDEQLWSNVGMVQRALRT